MFNYKPLACIPSFCMINKCYILPCLPPVYFTMFDTDTSAYLTVHFCYYTPPCISLTAPSPPPLAPVYLSLPPPPGPCISPTAPPGPCISLTAPSPLVLVYLSLPPLAPVYLSLPPSPTTPVYLSHCTPPPPRPLYISHCPPPAPVYLSLPPPGPCISLTALLRLLYISHCPPPRPLYISHCPPPAPVYLSLPPPPDPCISLTAPPPAHVYLSLHTSACFSPAHYRDDTLSMSPSVEAATMAHYHPYHGTRSSYHIQHDEALLTDGTMV